MKYITIPKEELEVYKLAYGLLNQDIKVYPLSNKQQQSYFKESVKIQVPILCLSQQIQIIKFLKNKKGSGIK